MGDLSPEEYLETFNGLPTITHFKDLKLSKFDRCHLLDDLVASGKSELPYEAVLSHYSQLTYSSKTLSGFFLSRIQSTNHMVFEDFLQLIPSREWHSSVNRDFVKTWLQV